MPAEPIWTGYFPRFFTFGAAQKRGLVRGATWDEASAKNISWRKITNTLGSPQRPDPRARPIVINEIMDDPPAVDRHEQPTRSTSNIELAEHFFRKTNPRCTTRTFPTKYLAFGEGGVDYAAPASLTLPPRRATSWS